jgi:hypothetical protein
MLDYEGFCVYRAFTASTPAGSRKVNELTEALRTGMVVWM